MILPHKNPWGQPGGLEIQRADLWVIDLGNLLRWLRLVYPGLQPLPSNPSFYARQVIFPELRINNEPLTKGTVPVNVPGYDQAIGEVRVDFIHDASVATPAGNGGFVPDPGRPASKIYTLLHAWHELARIGRGARSQARDTIMLASPVDLNQLSDRFRFQFDLDIQLYRGVMADTLDEAVPSTMDLACTYRLVGAWCAALQLSTLNYASANEVMVVTAAVFPDDILQLTPG